MRESELVGSRRGLSGSSICTGTSVLLSQVDAVDWASADTASVAELVTVGVVGAIGGVAVSVDVVSAVGKAVVTGVADAEGVTDAVSRTSSSDPNIAPIAASEFSHHNSISGRAFNLAISFSLSASGNTLVFRTR